MELNRISGGVLEHVNLTVSDPERSSALFQRLLGWHERWRGAAQGGRTIHVGNESGYLALFTGDEAGCFPYEKGVPMNHVGLLVDDLDGARATVEQAGLVPFGYGDYQPGRRFYFLDWDGIEFEVVSYA